MCGRARLSKQVVGVSETDERIASDGISRSYRSCRVRYETTRKQENRRTEKNEPRGRARSRRRRRARAAIHHTITSSHRRTITIITIITIIIITIIDMTIDTTIDHRHDENDSDGGRAASSLSEERRATRPRPLQLYTQV